MNGYEVVFDNGVIEVGRRGGELIAACCCGDGFTVPDKGLGHARIYTWQTRHQNCGAS